MAFTSGRPVVSGEKKGHRFVIRSAVDPDARICDTRIELTPADEAPFSEEHRHYFHRADEIRAALADTGFEVTAVRDEYCDRPADASTLSATWIARRALTHDTGRHVAGDRLAPRDPGVRETGRTIVPRPGPHRAGVGLTARPCASRSSSCLWGGRS